MRIASLLLLGAIGTAMAPAQDTSSLTTRVSTASVGRVSPEAVVYNGPRSKVSMYIWSDKYVYQPGQNLTLRWTLKTFIALPPAR